MISFPNIFPPTDLLQQYEGIKSGLKKRRKLGAIGWIGFLLASTAQLLVAVANSDYFIKLVKADWSGIGQFILEWWVYLTPVVLAAFFLLLLTWSRYWLNESREPFRYTCTVSPFMPVATEASEMPPGSVWDWLSHDLTEHLSQRIGRLFFIPPDSSEKPDSDSHIQVGGVYGLRLDASGQWIVDVMPRVRIGAEGNPETQSHPVAYPLASPDSGSTPEIDNLSASDYQRIIERVYFSVATELYKRIEIDVSDKISLLPTNYFRGVALFHEAEDYARSNTLDAYDEASILYQRAVQTLDPCIRPLPHALLHRYPSIAIRSGIHGYQVMRRLLSYLWPRLARRELIAAKAEIGYTTTVLYRRQLASFSGQRMKAVFDARPIAQRAIARLERIPYDTEGRKTVLFDAHVTMGLAWYNLGSIGAAQRELGLAQRISPRRAEQDARFLYVAAVSDPRRRSKLEFLRQATELEPRFEIPQFILAGQTEYLWRTRPTFERNVAQMAIAEYDRVSQVNPGNIAAWANRGYIYWLLGGANDLSCAKRAFDAGREYKSIKRTTFVAELDYGLARIEAEQADFRNAYEHYIASVAANLAQANANMDFHSYYFEMMGSSMFRRFENYRDTVEKHWRRWLDFDEPLAEWDALTALLSAGRRFDDFKDRLLRLFEAVDGCLGAGERAALGSVLARNASPGESNTQPVSLRSVVAAGAKAARRILLLNEVNHLIREKLASIATRRVRDSVFSFVMNDYGEACWSRYLYSGDEQLRDTARDAFLRCAEELNPDYVIPHFNLFNIYNQSNQSDEAQRALDMIIELAPNWPDGLLRLAEFQGVQAKDKLEQAAEVRNKAFDAQAEIAELEKRRESRADFLQGAQNSQIDSARDRFNQLSVDEQKLRQQSKRLADNVIKTVHRLLPHAWMWRVEAADPVFRWQALDSRRLERELAWERNCEDLHANALYWLATALKAQGKADKAWRLLSHLRKHFWPDHFNVHLHLLSLIADRVRDEVSSQDFVAMFEDEAHRQLLEVLSERNDFADARQRRAAGSTIMRRLTRSQKRIMASPTYLVLATLPGLRDTTPDQLSWALANIAERHLIAILQGPDFAALHDNSSYRQMLHDERALRLIDGQRYAWLFLTNASYRNLPSRLRRYIRSNNFRLLLRFAESQRVITHLLQREFTELNAPYHTLTWLHGRFFSIDNDPLDPSGKQQRSLRLDVLQRAIRIEHRSPYFYRWVGNQLASIEDGHELAIAAYGKTVESGDPGLLIDVGRRLRGMNEFKLSRSVFESAKLSGRDPDAWPEWAFDLQLALVDLAQGDDDSAFEKLDLVTSRARAISDWRRSTVDELSVYLHSLQRYQRVRSWLEGFRVTADSDDVLADVNRAILTLANRKYSALSSVRPQSMISVTTPIALEMAESIVPQGDVEKHPMLARHAPEMRARILQDLGTRIPGVRIRSSTEMPDDSYLIMLNEIPLVQGTVSRNWLFCPDPEIEAQLADDRGTLRGWNPLTTIENGLWLDPEVAVPPPEVRLWDHDEYIMRHVELVVRRNVTQFFGFQEMANTLEAWCQEGYDEENRLRDELVAKAVPSERDRIHLLHVMKRLLREMVPVTSLQLILDIFHAYPGAVSTDEHLIEIAETIRLHLTDCLPGNNAGSSFYQLSDTFEAQIEGAIRRSEGHCYLDLKPEMTRELLAALREVIGGDSLPNRVVVTRLHHIRPFVKLLIELEFPTVNVLARREVDRRLDRNFVGVVEFGGAETVA